MIRRPPGPPDAAVPERYLYRLSGVEIPPEYTMRIRGIRRSVETRDAAPDAERIYRFRHADEILRHHGKSPTFCPRREDPAFVRRSLRPVPRSRFSALTARAGDVFLVLCALVVLFGFLSRC